ncbi:MAG: hypothetical protein ACRDN6_10285 [Gaiellaceae bacterium]
MTDPRDRDVDPFKSPELSDPWKQKRSGTLTIFLACLGLILLVAVLYLFAA